MPRVGLLNVGGGEGQAWSTTNSLCFPPPGVSTLVPHWTALLLVLVTLPLPKHPLDRPLDATLPLPPPQCVRAWGRCGDVSGMDYSLSHSRFPTDKALLSGSENNLLLVKCMLVQGDN